MYSSKKQVSLKVSPLKLHQLFQLGVLCAADIQCADLEDRDIIRTLCLQACSEKICAQCEHAEQCSQSAALRSAQVLTPFRCSVH